MEKQIFLRSLIAIGYYEQVIFSNIMCINSHQLHLLGNLVRALNKASRKHYILPYPSIAYITTFSKMKSYV